MPYPTLRVVPSSAVACLLGALALIAPCAATLATTTLADQPVFAASNVPGNLALTLSVEYPTAVSVANLGNYADASTYLGYFDPSKCYDYSYNSATPASSYFKPAAFSTGTYAHTCSSKWSGNFMNWATMQTIDPFRWALTGGFRSVDTTTQTIIEKAWGSGQGGTSNFPYRGTSQGTGQYLDPTLVPKVTPFSGWSAWLSIIAGGGNQMYFYGNGASNGAQVYAGTSSQDPNTYYNLYVRVDVCDATTSLGVLGLESNCVPYGSNYKPEGLIQQYSNKIRFAALSYLNGLGSTRQGGVVREPMGYVGPTYTQPYATTPTTNPRAEWDPGTGIMTINPDSATASASSVSQSGVMNYLNKFGESARTYMTYDNVSELYYAAVRYYENLGNVPEWTNAATVTELDGFPAQTAWTDPILYACQKNFVLGIGDDHTHYDYNVGGGTAAGRYAPIRIKPSTVMSDSRNQAATWTANLQALEGITQTPWWALGGTDPTYYIAGLAYGTHVNDIRPDLAGTQTLSTFWMDVLEYQRAENLNPFYLATKYGGFTVPTNYSTSNTTTPLTQSWWDTSGNTINMNGYTQKQPDNYFEAGNAAQMVSGLKAAFTSIANAIKAYTTSFVLSSPVATASGTTSFAAQFASTGWTGTVTDNTLTFAADGTPSSSNVWSSSTTLQTQLSGTGWDTGRHVVTWNGSAGVAFRAANLTSAQQTALTPGYSSTLTCSTTACPYLNYLRGDQTNEVGSTVTNSTKSLRARTLFLGDIVDSKIAAVANPNMIFAESSNPGYTAFKSTYASRPTMAYVGANDGMLHAFVGASGAEQFAYVPSALYQGPNATPQVDGLAQLGNPGYTHHYYVDATPVAFDIDLNNAGGSFSSTTNWHTVLLGGLGKGGKSYYALDVTNPAATTLTTASEATVAGTVLWEFTDSTMGYSFGTPIVVKTAKYGWVVALTSGYNNSDGYGYLYLVNPGSGVLLEKIRTGSVSSGLTQAQAYVQNYSDYTADSIYAGDLNGQLWRFDLTLAKGATTAYPAPTLLATLTDVNGNAQPVTTAPLIEIQPNSRKRFVLLGTGQLLSSTDISSTATQSFYAIIDGTGSGFATVSTPITRSTLTAVTNVTAGVTLSNTAKGWYTDLGNDTSTNIGWRVVINPVAFNGIVAFSSLLTSGDACSPSGQSRVYALSYAGGTSVLTNNTTGYIASTNSVTDLKFVDVTGASSGTSTGTGTGTGTTTGGNSASSSGTTGIYYGTNTGTTNLAPANLAGSISTRILNWREIPTAD